MHHFTGHSHASSTAATSAHSGDIVLVETSLRLGLLLLRSGVSDGSVDRKDCASCLSGGLNHVEADKLGLPHEEVVKVLDSSSEDVDSDPHVFGLGLDGVTFSKGVEDISGVHSRVISELLGDDLERSGEGLHDQLVLTFDLENLLLQVAGQFHLDGTSSGNNGSGLDSSDDNHESIVEGSLGLLNVLGSSSSKDDSYGFGSGAAGEHVVAFVTELNFLELLAGSEDLLRDTVSGSLGNTTSGLGSSVQIVKGASSSAEDSSVSEVLSGEITDGKSGEDDLGSGGVNFIELIVDDFPLSINNFLEVLGVLESDFGVISLGLELKLDVEEENGGVLEALGLLFKSGVGKGLLEADTLNEHGVSGRSTGNFLNTNVLLVVVTIDGLDGVDNHSTEEFSVAGDNLGVEGGHGASLEDESLGSWVFVSHLDGDLSDAFAADGLGFTETLDNNLRVHALFNELLGILEELSGGENDGGGTISDFVVLGLGDIDQGLGGGVNNVEEADKSGTIVGDGHGASTVDEFIHTTGS